MLIPTVDLKEVGGRVARVTPEHISVIQKKVLPLELVGESKETNEGKARRPNLLAESLNYLSATIPMMADESKHCTSFWNKKEGWATEVISQHPVRDLKFVNFASNTGASATDYDIKVWTVKDPSSSEKNKKLIYEELIQFNLDPVMENPIRSFCFFIDAHIQAPNIFLLCRCDAVMLRTAMHFRLYNNQTISLPVADTTVVRSFGQANGLSADRSKRNESDDHGAPHGAACAISENGIFAFQVDTFEIIATSGSNSATPRWACCQNEPVKNLIFLPTVDRMGNIDSSFSDAIFSHRAGSPITHFAMLLAVSQQSVTEWKLSGISEALPGRRFVFGKSPLVSVVFSGSALAVFNDNKEVALLTCRDLSEPGTGLSVSLYALPVQVPSFSQMCFSRSKRQGQWLFWSAEALSCSFWGWSTADTNDANPVALTDTSVSGKVLPLASSPFDPPLHGSNKDSSGILIDPAILSIRGTPSALSTTGSKGQLPIAGKVGVAKPLHSALQGGDDNAKPVGLKEPEFQDTEGNGGHTNPFIPTSTSPKLTSAPMGASDAMPFTLSEGGKKTLPLSGNKVVLPTFCGSRSVAGGVGGALAPSILLTVADQGKAEVNKWLAEIDSVVQNINESKSSAVKEIDVGSARLISLSLEALMTVLEEHVKTQLLSYETSVSNGLVGNPSERNRDEKMKINGIKSFREENEALMTKEVWQNLEASGVQIIDGLVAGVSNTCKKDMIITVLQEFKGTLRDSQRGFIQKRFDELMKEPASLFIQRLTKSFAELHGNITGDVKRFTASYRSLKKENEELRQCISRLMSPRVLDELEQLRAEVVNLRETVAALCARNAIPGNPKDGNEPSLLSTVMHYVRAQNNLAGGLQYLVASQNPLLAVAFLKELSPAENDALIEIPEEIVPVEIWAAFVTQLSKACVLFAQEPLSAQSVLSSSDPKEVNTCVRGVMTNIVDIMTAQPALLGAPGSSPGGKEQKEKTALRRMQEALNELVQTMESNCGNDTSLQNILQDLKVSLR